MSKVLEEWNCSCGAVSALLLQPCCHKGAVRVMKEGGTTGCYKHPCNNSANVSAVTLLQLCSVMLLLTQWHCYVIMLLSKFCYGRESLEIEGEERHLLAREWLEGDLGSFGLRYCRKASSSPRGLKVGLGSAGRFCCGVTGAA